MRVKSVVSVILMLTFVCVLGGCGGGNASLSGGSSISNPNVTAVATGGGMSTAYDRGGGDSSAVWESYFDGYSPSKDKTVTADSAAADDRKVIRNANLEIMSPDAALLYKNIVDFSTGLGGYENSYSIVNHESYSVITAVIKIPPEYLSIFVNFIGDQGNVINSTMNSDDITENYYDAKTRLETKRKSLDQYYQLLMKANGIEEIVYINRIIDGITEDIEYLEGRLNL
ncbi:MAG: DUF4349 domain-containing protein [Clostridiales bacterium]|nr:DUF4349 domain-containing protein [Clostridiales bacterium]